VHSQVQSAIDSARGSGRPLDRSTRSRLEPALGGSLADVRVHEDARAAGLARAVSARAFAVGNDVFFASGEFRPGSSGGDALIAHEAVHTFQQRGAPANGRLTMSDPADPFEREASAIAASGLSSASLRQAPSGRRLSRAHTAFPIRVGGEDTKVWFEWSARWEDIDQTGSIDWPYGKTPGIYDRTVSQEVSGWTGTDRQKLRIVAGAKGTLWLKAVAHFFVDVPGDKNQEYTQTAWVSCSVTIGRDGKIHFGTAAASVIPNLQEDAWLAMINPTPSTDPDSGEVQLTVAYAGSQHSTSEGTSETRSGGGGVGVKGFEVNVDYSHGTSSESGHSRPAPSGQQAFIAKIEVPPTPDPKGTVDIKGPVRAFVDKTFEANFKSAGSSVLPHDERARLVSWYNGLSRVTRSRLKLGKQHIRLEAFTSQTQPADKNQDLADLRQKAVIKVIGRFVDPDNWAKHATAYGEDLLPDDRPGKTTEDPTMWLVVLKVVDEITPDEHGLDDAASFEDLMPE